MAKRHTAEPPIRIIIAGGRDFDDYDYLCHEMYGLVGGWKESTVNRIEIVTGGARGADALGERWCMEHLRKPAIVFNPNWTQGAAAGPLRNATMAQYAAHSDATPYGTLMAFWDGYSTGTRDMIERALHARLEVRVIRYEVIT